MTSRPRHIRLHLAILMGTFSFAWTPGAYSALDLPLVGRAAGDIPVEVDRRTDDLMDRRTLPPAQRETHAAEHVSRAQAAERARKQYGGRVLDVRWTGTHYRVKLLHSGNVRIVTIADEPNNKDP